ncbi:hypothetical protein PRZ48_005027 [Zasmidium cellare]|uniref:Uncharacterized protein n=1 Tax=Zasmidium cellare TaxID=395010 RepID=A0ABR0ERK8_ZASCE|nr:hypothetical protein PRZ48_005027 [Zasmidium cellare]
MGIHGIFKEIGSGQRISLVKLASDHYIAHDRPFRLAIDISIWLFQIQAGKGGSNPALRTFYYRLLRLLSFNIHPLFVFDGPNKPLFKRNKKVGGPGVRVASVPEFLAKQLLKQFGFPWHVAPGEAEAECALLQREGIVDGVLSEDVDTLMFGSGLTLRNWTTENTSKTPTHVNVYRATETKEKSGLDREGMILVALMSGGDYITEGIPGCGPKVACDAARAGFGKEMCELVRKKDTAGLKAWRERLQDEIRTNKSKFFTRKNSTLTIPEDFPDREVLGYYTNPCLSTPDKLAKVRAGLKWDQEIDFPALRSFAADAFDWRCLGGAKKFIRNLAPAMLIRELRLRSNENLQLSQEAQAERENEYVTAIHGKRNHTTTDAELEYRITFIPMTLVPIDLSIEDEDDDFIPAGAPEDPSDAENDFVPIPSSTADEEEPASPTKKRTAKPYEPDQPEKIWIMHSFLKVGCPLLVEDYEANLRDPKQLFKQRKQARAAASGKSNIHAKKTSKKKANDMPEGAMKKFTTVSKSSQVGNQPSTKTKDREPLQTLEGGGNSQGEKPRASEKDTKRMAAAEPGFILPSTQLSPSYQQTFDYFDTEETPKAAPQPTKPPAKDRPFAAFATKSKKQKDAQKTPPGRKRPMSDVASSAQTQRTIDSFYSPSPRKPSAREPETINLISSSPARPEPARALTPTPQNRRTQSTLNIDVTTRLSLDYSPGKLPDTVTKRRKKDPLKRHQTAPVRGEDIDPPRPTPTSRPSTPDVVDLSGVNVDAPMSSPDDFLPPIPMRRLNDPAPPSRPASAPTKDPAAPPPPTTQRPPPPKPSTRPTSSKQPTRRSPRQQAKKKRIQLRESLEGAWKEVDAEMVDMTGDGSGWKKTQGKAKVSGWRKSGIEVLDLTGA